jgi:predicted transcriptional regulator
MSPALIHALDHSLRRQILRRFTKQNPEWSPAELARSLSAGLSHLSYHARVLSDLGAIGETRTEFVRGATQHFYASKVTDSKLVRTILAKTKEDDKETLG